ncbi:MAG: GNAT family N-acetyltransferase [Bacteroidales bacterium]|nr:GNAT family N-acetyltransferase [Bacteroidales bacterium]
MKESIPGFAIRKAEKKDIILILDFIKALAKYEKMSELVSAVPSDIEKYIFSEDAVAHVVIGEYEGMPVGFALYFYNFSTFLGKPGIYLEDLFVHEEMRGRGFGKELLKYLARLAVEKNCGRLEWCVLDWNTPSIKFYKSLGAEIKKEWLLNRLSGESLIRLAETID